MVNQCRRPPQQQRRSRSNPQADQLHAVLDAAPLVAASRALYFSACGSAPVSSGPSGGQLHGQRDIVRTFERVLFLIGFLLIDVYTTRHIYHLWLEPRSSVLDEFKGDVQSAIGSASQVQDLLKRYRPAHEAVRKLQEQNRGKSPDAWRFEDQEPFKSEAALRQAIEEWEQKQRDLFEMRVYWSFGLIGAILGLIVHRKASQWLGLAFLITGVAEMIWWCSPTWFSQATAETQRLLGNKLALSLTTMLLFMGTARLLGLLKNDARRVDPSLAA
jgi:hypothetical protein